MLSTIPRITKPTPTTGRAPSHSPPDTRYVPGNSVVRFLGWFSIGLGLTEIICRKQFAKAIGVQDHPVLLPLFGAREIMAGIGLLTEARPTEWLWARVAGDAMDLSALGTALAADNTDKERVGIATAAVVGVTLLDLMCATQVSAAAALEP